MGVGLVFSEGFGAFGSDVDPPVIGSPFPAARIALRASSRSCFLPRIGSVTSQGPWRLDAFSHPSKRWKYISSSDALRTIALVLIRRWSGELACGFHTGAPSIRTRT